VASSRRLGRGGRRYERHATFAREAADGHLPDLPLTLPATAGLSFFLSETDRFLGLLNLHANHGQPKRQPAPDDPDVGEQEGRDRRLKLGSHRDPGGCLADRCCHRVGHPAAGADQRAHPGPRVPSRRRVVALGVK
jgi:hypothetical protein